jgi:hypothetical protein
MRTPAWKEKTAARLLKFEAELLLQAKEARYIAETIGDSSYGDKFKKFSYALGEVRKAARGEKQAKIESSFGGPNYSVWNTVLGYNNPPLFVEYNVRITG